MSSACRTRSAERYEPDSTNCSIKGRAAGITPYAEFRRQRYRIANGNGIRFHRQRHTYAYLRYKRVLGADCPVMASVAHGQPHIEWLALKLKISEAEAKERDQKVRAQIAQELGHGRIEVTHAYLG